MGKFLQTKIFIWGDRYKSYLNKLIKLQKWAIKTVSNSHYRSHTQFLANFLTVTDMHTNELPPSSCSLITILQDMLTI